MAKLIVTAGRELFGHLPVSLQRVPFDGQVLSSEPRKRLRGTATSSRALQASDFGRRDRGTSGDHLGHKPLQGRELRVGSSRVGEACSAFQGRLRHDLPGATSAHAPPQGSSR
eukprot:15471349-Alexandrium_andersonii.AAC.1